LPVLPTESHYKDRETEEFLDIYFYRPFGSVLAVASRRLGLSPNAVTILSMIVGVIAGHLFSYSSMRLTIAGIFLLILSDALDSADGQLARLTGKISRTGRILDGLAGNIVFISVYVNICLRYAAEGGSPWIFALGGAAGFCHSFQAALADFYRNGYLHFVRGPGKCEMDSADSIQQQYRRLTWKENRMHKFLLLAYVGHMRQQEMVARQFMRLRTEVDARYGQAVPDDLRLQYGRLSRPMIKYYNILTINTRVIALFIFLLLSVPYLYFVFELAVMNLLFIYVIVRQEQISENMIAALQAGDGVKSRA
jgi:hypothetical protein